ncbi:hypothetical protein B0H14DRAFT_3910307 [Mycena olivaceomarginata]|nr:hypothetical protein B0H14DRAFT_3910307 [Mycena olivaceomarginata]
MSSRPWRLFSYSPFFSMAVATYFITAQDIPRTPAWFNAHLASVLGGDLLLTFDDGIRPPGFAPACPSPIRAGD